MSLVSIEKYKGMNVRSSYLSIADDIENLEVRDDDVWICSFPKSGTTWVQQMAWLIGNDLDFEGGQVPLIFRSPHLEAQMVGVESKINVADTVNADTWRCIVKSVETVNKMQSPRYIKTHLPFQLLPKQIRTGERKPKLIYISRNPKDVCVSSYYHYATAMNIQWTPEEFYPLFLQNELTYTFYWPHVFGYWNRRHDENVLFLKFEDMKADLPSVIEKTASFLGKQISSAQVKMLAENLSFESMRANPGANKEDIIEMIRACSGAQSTGTKFIRNGEIGQWKTAMAPHIIEKFDDWIDENVKGTDYVL